MNYLQKKKLAFMSIVNRVKGFVRTVTGVLPLTLTNCVDEESIIDYTLYGQSVQNGTPTPETPVEVESVGEKTRNLLNAELLADINNWTFSSGGDLGYFYLNQLGLEDGKTYTLSYEITQSLRSDMSVALMKNAVSFKKVEGDTGTITFTQNSNYIQVYGPFANAAKTLYMRVYDSIRIMLEEGDTATPYEPYGYKIPIKVSGNDKTIITNIYLDEPLGEGQSINYKRDGLPTIPTFKGTNIISADTTIQPSNVEIEYYSNVKE